MAQVSVTINGRQYEVRCDDGQEAHLYKLADYVNVKVSELAKALGQIGEARLLLMVSLLIVDELGDVRSELEALRRSQETKTEAIGQISEDLGASMEELARRLDDVADRINTA
jgi:cell division protein ZapA